MPCIVPFDPYVIPGKDWGREEVVARTPDALGKILTMREGTSGPLQYHRVKDECFHVVSGLGRLTYDDEAGRRQTLDLTPGMSIHVPPGAVHQVAAVTELVLFEVGNVVFDDRVAVL